MKNKNAKTKKVPWVLIFISLSVFFVSAAGYKAFAPIIIPAKINTDSTDHSEILGASTQYIGEDAVKAIVMRQIPGATFIDINELYLEYGNEKAVYDGALTFKDMQYEFKIDATDGSVVEWNVKENATEIDTDDSEQTEPEDIIITTNVSYIGINAAKTIALNKVPGATLEEFSLEYDDGRAEYEGEMYLGNTTYEFKIDALTGEIFEWETEINEDETSAEDVDDEINNPSDVESEDSQDAESDDTPEDETDNAPDESEE